MSSSSEPAGKSASDPPGLASPVAKHGQEWFRDLAELSSDWFWEQDADFRFTALEGEMHARTGLVAQTTLGKRRWELGILGVSEKGWQAHRAALACHETFRDFNYQYVNKDGAIRSLSVSGKPVFDAAGRFVGYRGIGRDVTDQKHAEAAQLQARRDVEQLNAALQERIAETQRQAALLRENGDRFRDWAEQASDWFWEQDAEFRFAPISGDNDAKWAFAPHYLDGKRRWELDIIGVGEDQWRAHRELLLRHEPFHDFVYQRVNGGKLRWVSVSGKPVFAADGSFAGYRGIGRDITEQKRAETTLRDSEHRLLALLELSTDWYWVQDEQYRLRRREGAVLDREGLPAEPDLGKTHWELDYFNMTAADWAAHRLILTRREEFRNLLLARRAADGKVRWARLSGRPLYDAGGTFMGYHGVGQGVTGQVQAELALRESEAQLRLVTDNVPAAIGYIDRDLVLRFTNRGFRNLFDADPLSAIGRHMREVMGPEQFDEVEQHFNKVMAGQSVTYRRTDGSAGAAPRVFNVDLVPHRSEDNAIAGCYALATDITVSEQARELILGLERLFTSALEATTDLMALYGWDGRRLTIERFNPALRNFYEQRFPGVRIAEWIGLPLDAFLGTVGDLSAETAAQRIAPFLRAAQTAKVLHYRSEIASPTGPQQCDALLVPITDATGQVTHLFYRGADITEVVRQEQQLLRLNQELERKVAERTAELSAANRELEAFAYSVSHDLRTPLRGIDGFSELLTETKGDHLDDEGREYLRRIRRGIQRMGGIIDDLLRLSRVTRGQIRRETVNLSALAAEIAANLQRQAAGRSVDWRLQKGVTVMADTGLMRVVLENLLGNAWKYTRDSKAPVIEFAAARGDGGLEFLVRDNGAGFDMAYAGKLFQAFQRLHGAREFEGSGIGLATVARVVQRLGGRIRAEGVVGAGAVIHVFLPDQGANG